MTTKQRFPFFKFYPQDWIEATRKMTLEERGAYIDLIALTMQIEQALSDDDAWVSHAMHVSARKWRTVKSKLQEHGKIRIEDGKIVNDRCLKELEALLGQRRNIAEAATARERTKREPAASQARMASEKSKKANENNIGDTTAVHIVREHARVSDLDLDLDRDKDTTLRARVQMTAEEADAFRNRLLSAANGAMANPAACPGILVLSEPLRWLENGCDLEQDILPTLKARGHSARQNSIRTWGYFTQAVADAKATRERPLPGAGPQRPAAGGNWRDRAEERRDATYDAIESLIRKSAGESVT